MLLPQWVGRATAGGAGPCKHRVLVVHCGNTGRPGSCGGGNSWRKEHTGTCAGSEGIESLLWERSAWILFHSAASFLPAQLTDTLLFINCLSRACPSHWSKLTASVGRLRAAQARHSSQPDVMASAAGQCLEQPMRMDVVDISSQLLDIAWCPELPWV